MKILLAMLPTVILVVFSQLATKWRVHAAGGQIASAAQERLATYLADPWIWAAYGAAFLGGVCWMFVVERYALSVAFPVYIGLTVLCVVLGGMIFFGETLTYSQLAAIVLILGGVALAVRS